MTLRNIPPPPLEFLLYVQYKHPVYIYFFSVLSWETLQSMPFRGAGDQHLSVVWYYRLPEAELLQATERMWGDCPCCGMRRRNWCLPGRHFHIHYRYKRTQSLPVGVIVLGRFRRGGPRFEVSLGNLFHINVNGFLSEVLSCSLYFILFCFSTKK